MVKKGLLFVSYYFPPTKSIASVRNYNICSQFLNEWKVIVLTTKNQRHFAKDNFPKLSIAHYSHLYTFDIRTLIKRKQLKSRINNNRSVSFIHKLLRSFPFNIFFGIGGLLYVLHGLWVGLKHIRKNDIKVLYSSYFPYSDHLICFLLKSFHKDLKWVADFRDLQYYPSNEEIILPKIQRFFNHRILKHANLLTTVSEGLKTHLVPFNKNVLVVRNSIGISNEFKSPKPKLKNKESLILSYTGNIIPGKSSTESIFKILKEFQHSRQDLFEKITFNYVGAYHDYFNSLSLKYGVNQVCNISSTIPLNESFEIQKNADINILLSFNYPNLSGILTGKFYEYLSAKKPILLIINGSKDYEFEYIFNELNCGKVFYAAEPQMEEKAINYIDLVSRNPNALEFLYNQNKLSEYSAEYQVKKIINHLKKL